MIKFRKTSINSPWFYLSFVSFYCVIVLFFLTRGKWFLAGAFAFIGAMFWLGWILDIRRVRENRVAQKSKCLS